MKGRRHGRKPTLALWMLVAVADAAVLVTTAGLATVLAVVAGLVVVACGLIGFRLTQRRAMPEPARRLAVAVTAPPVARRRA